MKRDQSALTSRQRVMLGFLQRVNGAVALTTMPFHGRGMTLNTMAARGLVEIEVKITDSGKRALEENT